MSPAERADLIADLRAQSLLCDAGGARVTAAYLLRSAAALEEADRLLALDALRPTRPHASEPPLRDQDAEYNAMIDPRRM